MASYNNEAKTAESPVGEATGARRLISFVLPVYDEETTLRELHGQITAVMNRIGLDRCTHFRHLSERTWSLHGSERRDHNPEEH